MERLITILGPDRTPTGPFSAQEVLQKIDAGEVPGDSLAHSPGLATWQPVRQVLSQLVPLSPKPVFAPPQSYPTQRAYALSMGFMGVDATRYASFPARSAAFFLDGVIFLGGVMGAVFFAFLVYTCLSFLLIAAGGNGNHPADGELTPYQWIMAILSVVFFFGLPILVILFAIFGGWLYHARMESGPEQGTWGKRIMGIRVTDLEGNRISFMQATGRHVARMLLTNHTGLIGYFIALFTERKQTVHDLVAKTIVVEK